MKQLRDTKALVTGAAGGIGRCIALGLAEQGVHVALLDVDAAGLDAVADEVRAAGVEAIALPCDLTQTDAIDAALDALLAQWSDIHILVNNAGVCFYGAVDRMADVDWDRTLAINLQAPIRLTHKLLPVLQAQDEAHIVNICSMFGLYAFRHAAAYVATKHALVGLAQSLRYDYAGSGLGASAICPGFVHGTAFFADAKRSPPAWICCTPQRVAQRTIKAIRRNRAIVVITPLARVLWWANRLSPWLVDRLLQLGWGASRRRKRRQRRSKTT